MRAVVRRILAFELVVGHYGFGKAWSELLADYDLRRGRIWVAVLVVTLLAPLWTVRVRQTLPPGVEPRADQDG